MFWSKILFYNCFVLGMGCLAKGPMVRVGCASKRAQMPYHWRVGVSPGVSGSHNKRPNCSHVSSGLRAIQWPSAVIRLVHYEASLVWMIIDLWLKFLCWQMNKLSSFSIFSPNDYIGVPTNRPFTVELLRTVSIQEWSEWVMVPSHNELIVMPWSFHCQLNKKCI